MLATSFVLAASLGAAAPTAPAPHDDHASPPALWIRAERVHVRPGHVLEDAAVLVERGRIVAVGEGVEAPEGARRIEGAVVCAGFLDPWSNLGVTADMLEEDKADSNTRVADALDVYAQDHLRREALEAGVTAVRLQGPRPGEVSGIGPVARNLPAVDDASLIVLADACVSASVGLTERGRTADVFDRVKAVDKLVKEIEDGLEYRASQVEYRRELEAWEAAIAEKEEELEKDFKKAKKDREKEIEKAEEKGKEHKEERYKEERKPKPPRFDAQEEVWARIAHGELPLVVEAHRGGEVRELLDATERFGRLRLILAGASEARGQAERLAERGIPVIVWPRALGRYRDDEHDGHDLSLAAELADAGVEVLLGSGGEASARDLPLLAAQAVGHGLDRDAALAALTTRAAASFDVGERLGSVERGKDADLLVLTGDPLSVASRVQYVIVGGEVVVQP